MNENSIKKKMGIKHFQTWFRQTFPETFIPPNPPTFDILAIDMNGIFHLCAEQFYGKHRYRRYNSHILFTKVPNLLFKHICKKIEEICTLFSVRKYIILCMDGVAGMAKCQQQRQRRFQTFLHEPSFDMNQFSPGTILMDQLSRYIDWYIHMNLSKHWKHCQIIFSNEKVPGEGEHKIFQFLHQWSNDHDQICIYSGDSDVILLSLIHSFSIYVLRDVFPSNESYEFISIPLFRKSLLSHLEWTHSTIPFDTQLAYLDFVGLTCLLGNDFLPNIPSLYFPLHFPLLLQQYRTHGSHCGHLFRFDLQRLIFTEHSALFFKNVGELEKSFIEIRYARQDGFFPDPIVIQNSRVIHNQFEIHQWKELKHQYYQSRFLEKDTTIVNHYMNGLEWVINYYFFGMNDWNWYYPYHYAPFISDFDKIQYTPQSFIKNDAPKPFLQLLMILPPNSKSLLPFPLQKIMEENSSLLSFFPNTFEIDVTGKNKEWEGIILIPFPDKKIFKTFFESQLPYISSFDHKRNIVGKNFIYQYQSNNLFTFHSVYGDIESCSVFKEFIL